MESEFINFENLRKFVIIEDISLLTTYLKEVFKDLSDRADSNKKKRNLKSHISRIHETPYFNCGKIILII